VLNVGEALSLSQLRKVLYEGYEEVILSGASVEAIAQSVAVVEDVITRGEVVYGVNTGFGRLAGKRINDEDLALLQRSLVLSHAAGVGEPLEDALVRLIMVLKSRGLARGFSGVRQVTIDRLLDMINLPVYPVIPKKGSVGASGDLAPLAHMALPMLGEGFARVNGEVLTGADALRSAAAAAEERACKRGDRTGNNADDAADTAGAHAAADWAARWKPIELGPKEGLGLLNGTQVSTSYALKGLFLAEDLFRAAVACGAMSVEAFSGSRSPFDARIHAARGQQGQIDAARAYRYLLTDTSEIGYSHINCDRVQDPYSLRCQPQVMGACLDLIRHAAGILETEANSASDNPLVFADNGDIISGGNFHAEPVAMAADMLAIALAEMSALAERRIAILVDPNMSRLPAFLVPEAGLNSGFMIAHVTAAALASQNKTLAMPSSVDSLPTSAGQEDAVSMAPNAGMRLWEMADNLRHILAVELLAAGQGLDFKEGLRSTPKLEAYHEALRAVVPFYDHDRFVAPDIEAAAKLIADGLFAAALPAGMLPSDAA
jgi:histidine ammonia-lyase